jgi:tRNA(adenine34) deaminase
MDATSRESLDTRMMERCIALARAGLREREMPFACLICRDDHVVAEAMNAVRRSGDITRHAEMVAMSAAQKVVGRRRLSGCTLYTTVEPCAMCSYAIRETRISRVVFAMRSPRMGGSSKWNVLTDSEISHVMPEIFGRPPELRAGVLRHEAEQAWKAWNPFFWGIIRMRGVFGGEADTAAAAAVDVETMSRRRRSLLRSILRLE